MEQKNLLHQKDSIFKATVKNGRANSNWRIRHRQSDFDLLTVFRHLLVVKHTNKNKRRVSCKKKNACCLIPCPSPSALHSHAV